MPGEEPPSAQEYLQAEEARREALFRAFDDAELGEIVEAAHVASRVAPSIEDEFYDAIHRYPTHNLERARSIYSALANSTDPRGRAAIGYIIDGLAQVDPETGLALWRQLVRDPEERVREAATGQLITALGENERSVTSMGISLTDALHLKYDLEQAEQGINIHDPQGEAYKRLLARAGIQAD